MITAFIDMVGAADGHPAAALLRQDASARAGFGGGMLVSSFSVAQLISAPMWGRCLGRVRPAAGAARRARRVGDRVHHLRVRAELPHRVLLLPVAHRSGRGGGTVSVIQAYVADSVAPEDRARGARLALRGDERGRRDRAGARIALAQSRAAVARDCSRRLLCALNILFACRYLPESHDAKARLRTRGRAHAARRRPPRRVERTSASRTRG